MELADRLGAVFLNGDDFHSAANIALMAAGLSLTDDMREPWLGRLAREVEAQRSAGPVFLPVPH
jgi:gluconokinase